MILPGSQNLLAEAEGRMLTGIKWHLMCVPEKPAQRSHTLSEPGKSTPLLTYSLGTVYYRQFHCIPEDDHLFQLDRFIWRENTAFPLPRRHLCKLEGVPTAYENKQLKKNQTVLPRED